MASIFLSYDRDDLGKARPIALALEKAGHRVWWDRRIKGGSEYSKEIEKALKDADAVVVLWSNRSIESPWVRDEAAAGRDRKRLVPVRLDAASPPLGFRQFQTVDIEGRPRRAQIDQLNEAIAAVAKAEPPIAPAFRPQGLRRPSLAVAAVVLLLFLAVAYFAWRFYEGRRAVPLVAVASTSASTSGRELADDLLVKLTQLQSQNANALSLADAAQARRPDLLFKIDGSLGRQPRANLVLQSGRDKTLLWSRDFEESGKAADLKQQIGFVAAEVLSCASDGLMRNGQRLSPPTLKVYLNACADFSELGDSDPQPLLPAFLRVIAQRPRFLPAWKKLLLAEVAAIDVSDAEQRQQIIGQIRKHIGQARQIDPDMTEAAIAEATILPARAYGRRIALLDQVVKADPENVAALLARSSALIATSRVQQGVADAETAARLDPLSPHTLYLAFLSRLFAGDVSGAEKIRARAEDTWPGSGTIRDMETRLNFRFGNPEVALRLMQEEHNVNVGSTLFLKARIDPSADNIRRMTDYMEARMHSGEASPSGSDGLNIYVQALGQFDLTDRALDLLLNWPRADDLSAVSDVFFRPALRGVRQDPRFMRVAQRAGLISHWRASGKWPDFCFQPDLPYDCKKEAARLGA